MHFICVAKLGFMIFYTISALEKFIISVETD